MINNAALVPRKFAATPREEKLSGESGNREAAEPVGKQEDAPMTPAGESENREAAESRGETQPSRQTKRIKKETTPFAKTEPAPHTGYQFQYKDDKDMPVMQKETEVAYHGTYPMLVPRIISEGLMPSLGAGSAGLHPHYGVAVPGVYVSPIWKCATNYPMRVTTGPIVVGSSGSAQCHSGATLVANDGTFPLRAAFRVLVRKDRRLWRRH